MQYSYEVRVSRCRMVHRVSLIVSPQAQEDNEMDLIEGELIEEIEQLDEGWWSGVGAGGSKQGLFPGALYTLV